ncbi:MAG: Ig-like domain-containing protein [Candidatus Palauibacterales bacterium]|nr:Ig-like domain-containing protein [Candidatus Palauibacterales bacterium]MDP2528821.1 Ig-like domain-containing protein [Candidatus Palauibacterales bacterium]
MSAPIGLGKTALSILATVVMAGCSGAGVSAPPASTLLLNVAPAGGSSGVSVDTTITITFNHPMNPAMSRYASVHEGDISGPVVDGSWSWSVDTTILTFTPASALKAATTYVIHLGGGMMDAEGDPVDMSQYGPGCGGQTATAGMMGGGGGSGGMGPGMGSGMGSEMGQGWEGSDGTYGMIFTFMTSGQV